jgi:hypothetical protein
MEEIASICYSVHAASSIAQMMEGWAGLKHFVPAER